MKSWLKPLSEAELLLHWGLMRQGLKMIAHD